MTSIHRVRRAGAAFAGPLLACLLAWSGAASADAARTWPVPPHGVVAVEEAQLDPAYWVRRLGADADTAYLDPGAIAALNARLVAEDDSVRDMAAFPREVAGDEVRGWIDALSSRPRAARYDAVGREVDGAFFDALDARIGRDAIPARVVPRFGLVVARADLRAWPTAERLFSAPGDTDIDRLQESALFPGDAVAVLHATDDGTWSFVASDRYLAWIESAKLATGDADAVLAYGRRSPALVVTGATARTVFNPERPEVSELQLDMGVRLPRLADWPPDRAVHGQHPLYGHVVELPARRADGSLELLPALLPRTADVADAPLPLTPAHLIRQAFKFLGERYGWGHAYNARDCSGFVSEVYRSLGVQLPRNTGDQAVSPAFDKTLFSADDGRDARMAAVADLRVGDLVFVPGHVMMVIGREGGLTYVIHDTVGIGYRGPGGGYVRMPLDGVVVTPLEPLMAGEDATTIDRITSIVRIR